MTSLPSSCQQLDLRTTKCPLNFVKTKLALEKLATGEVLEVWIAAEGESTLNIPQSIAQEGHVILKQADRPDQVRILWIEKR